MVRIKQKRHLSSDNKGKLPGGDNKGISTRSTFLSSW